MLVVNSVLSADEYKDLRWEVIKRLEGVKEFAYMAGEGTAVIGVGFNIENNSDLLEKVFINLDMFPASDDEPDLDANYRTQIASILQSETMDGGDKAATDRLQSRLQAVMDQRIDDNNALPEEDRREGLATQFKIPSSEAEQRAMFEEAVKSFEKIVDKFIGSEGFPYSSERVALLSLAYHSIIDAAGGGSDNLRVAIQSDNRIRAWFEIRYISNGGVENEKNGIAKRRYLEAELFGLYPGANNYLNPQGEVQFEAYAKSIIKFLEEDAYPSTGAPSNLVHMINYERSRGHMIAAARAEVNAMEGVSLEIPSWGQVFKTIATYLINHFTKNESIKFDGTNYFFDGDVNLGLDINGIIQSTEVGTTGKDKNDLLIAVNDEINNILDGGKGDDFLIGAAKDDELKGGDGNDVLVGKDGADKLDGGKGNDLLLGGSGTDTYIFEGNFGTDIIKDSDGNGSISIAGWSGGFTSVQGSDIIFRDAGNKFEAIKINNGSTTDLLITSLTDEATGNILIKNWNSGNLGISLTVDTTTTPGIGAGMVYGDGGNNAITLDNLRDNNPTLDLSTFTALYADGGVGNDIIMGTLNGNDTLLGGDGHDIISGGFTATLGPNASGTFQSGAGSSGVDSIDGGAGNDFIFAAAGGSIAHGGSGNDVLLAKGPAYFQFNNLAEVLADEANGIAGHRAIKRDEVYADAIIRMNFGVVKNGLNYQLNHNYFTDFTSSYAEYNSAIEGVKFIGRSGGATSNHNNGDVSYGFAGSYSLTYDYSNSDEFIGPATSARSTAIDLTAHAIEKIHYFNFKTMNDNAYPVKGVA